MESSRTVSKRGFDLADATFETRESERRMLEVLLTYLPKHYSYWQNPNEKGFPDAIIAHTEIIRTSQDIGTEMFDGLLNSNYILCGIELECADEIKKNKKSENYGKPTGLKWVDTKRPIMKRNGTWADAWFAPSIPDRKIFHSIRDFRKRHVTFDFSHPRTDNIDRIFWLKYNEQFDRAFMMLLSDAFKLRLDGIGYMEGYRSDPTEYNQSFTNIPWQYFAEGLENIGKILMGLTEQHERECKEILEQTLNNTESQ